MTVAGIDVGEDYLDVAVIKRRRLRLARVDLRGLGEKEYEKDSTIERFAGLIESVIPELAAGAIALIDSPRWPRDLDCSKPRVILREGEVRARTIDEALRSAMRRIEGPVRLSMFPTPKLEYFMGQLAVAFCKPHLRALGNEMFGDPLGGEVCRGGTFTRFMIAGFATYRALERIGVECFESYPDLQFRLWNGGAGLPSKMKGACKAEALKARQEWVGRVAGQFGIRPGAVTTLDAADAAIMALSVAGWHDGSGERVIIENQAEGQFLFVMPSRLLSSRDDWKLRTRASKQEGVKA